ncbi:MAG: mrdA, partial [Candidatus Aminicenantes bacterium]|nr:mrdA [Candidatus Aminicenantes bacterium]
MKALKEVWYPGETISVAIGQGQLQVTPLQVAAMTALVARRGRKMPPPHLLLADGPPEDGGAGTAAGGEPQFKASEFESVIAGMWKSANDGGTGKGA